VAEAFHSTTDPTRPLKYGSPKVSAKRSCPAGCLCDLLGLLHGPHRVGVRLVMILLSHQRWPLAAIAELLGCDPSTVRRWIHRDTTHGVAGLGDRPRAGRPRLGSPRLGRRRPCQRPLLLPGGPQGHQRQLHAFLEQLLAAYPTAPVVAVICDNVIIHHSKLVKCWLTTHSPTLTIQGRVGQVHAFFHAHSPEQLLATTAPDSSPWLPEESLQSFSRPPSIQMDSCAKATG
jgi:hypothetical protein